MPPQWGGVWIERAGLYTIISGEPFGGHQRGGGGLVFKYRHPSGVCVCARARVCVCPDPCLPLPLTGVVQPHGAGSTTHEQHQRQNTWNCYRRSISAWGNLGGGFRLISPPKFFSQSGPFLAPWAELTCVFCREVLVPVYCTSGSVLMLVLCIPKIDFVYVVSIPKDCFVSAVYPKDHGSRNCTQGTKIWGCPNPPPPPNATDVQHLVTRSRLLLSVLDTLPQGGGGVKGWVGGSEAFFSGFWEAWTPPPRGWVGVGFCWVLGLRALGLRGIENFNIVLPQ